MLDLTFDDLLDLPAGTIAAVQFVILSKEPEPPTHEDPPDETESP